MANFKRPLKMFQHTAARRRLLQSKTALIYPFMFQHTAARRRLHSYRSGTVPKRRFQHTAARRRLLNLTCFCFSTFSFNTQPHEGGCSWHHSALKKFRCFNTQPHEGGCSGRKRADDLRNSFNTQPHEGGCFNTFDTIKTGISFNTQPHEGGCVGSAPAALDTLVSTHSRTKAAARKRNIREKIIVSFQHTAARRRLLGD